jgi:phosphatidylinositol-3-phosphatase
VIGMIRARASVLACLLAIGQVALVGCAGGGNQASPGAVTTQAPAQAVTGPAPSRVAVLVLENHESGRVLGSSQAPYLRSLAHRYALVTADHGLGHPSLLNYVGLVTGRTAGITTDCVPSRCPVAGRSLVDQLEQAGISWRGYMESMPRPCFHYSADELGRYAQRHNPFAYLTNVWKRPARCHKVVPLTTLRADLRSGLPRFSWITPNLCHDMHDCGIAVGDRWLSRTVPPLLRALGPRGVLVITFDEGTTDAGCCGGAKGGRIATILAGAGVRRRAVSNEPVDHYSTLATIETALGLPRLAGAKSAPALTPLLEPGVAR